MLTNQLAEILAGDTCIELQTKLFSILEQLAVSHLAERDFCQRHLVFGVLLPGRLLVCFETGEILRERIFVFGVSIYLPRIFDAPRATNGLISEPLIEVSESSEIFRILGIPIFSF